jgi:hypothetical protein
MTKDGTRVHEWGLHIYRAFEGAGIESEAAERIATEIYDASGPLPRSPVLHLSLKTRTGHFSASRTWLTLNPPKFM